MKTPERPEADRRALLARFDFDAYSRQPISFHHCQAGFAASAHKPVVVWTTDRHPEGSAAWRPDGATGQAQPLPVEDRGINRWGRQEWLVDLSPVNQPGSGTVNVRFGDLQAESSPIAIHADGYERLMQKAAAHYHYKQCGVTCHRRDGLVYSLEQEDFGRILGQVPAHGGWHDAHDDNKWLPLVWMPLYGLLKAQEFFAAEAKDYAADRDYCLEEAQWEIEWLLRMQKPDGSFYHAVWEWAPRDLEGRKVLKVWSPPPYDDLCDDRRAVVDCWGPGVAGRMIGVTTVTTPSTAPKYFACVAHNLLHFARLADGIPAKAAVAENCRAAAERTLAYLGRLAEIPPYQALELDALLAQCELERYRSSTRSTEALRACEARLDRVLARQQPEGHFHSAPDCRALEWYPEEAGDERVLVDYPFGYVLALTEYLEEGRRQPAACLRTRPVEESLRRFANLLAGFCRQTGFRQMIEPRLDRPPAVLPLVGKTGHGYNPLILAAGTVLAAAGRLLDNREWTQLAECQLYWVLGHNPRFMSFMNDVGVRHSGSYGGKYAADEGRYYLTAFYRHPRDMRWGVTTGIYAGADPEYPMCGLSPEGQYDSKAQETWLNCNGWFLRLLAELAIR